MGSKAPVSPPVQYVRGMTVGKLGKPVTDIATGMKGMLVHMQYYLGGNLFYNFQPLGLDKKTGLPLGSFWVGKDRIKGLETEEVELPTEILGTIVTDEASGFTGTATAIVLHISGCVHIEITPADTDEHGCAVKAIDLDIRRLKGKAVKIMTEPERKRDQQQRPSPAPMPACGPRAM